MMAKWRAKHSSKSRKDEAPAASAVPPLDAEKPVSPHTPVPSIVDEGFQETSSGTFEITTAPKQHFEDDKPFEEIKPSEEIKPLDEGKPWMHDSPLIDEAYEAVTHELQQEAAFQPLEPPSLQEPALFGPALESFAPEVQSSVNESVDARSVASFMENPYGAESPEHVIGAAESRLEEVLDSPLSSVEEFVDREPVIESRPEGMGPAEARMGEMFDRPELLAAESESRVDDSLGYEERLPHEDSSRNEAASEAEISSVESSVYEAYTVTDSYAPEIVAEPEIAMESSVETSAAGGQNAPSSVPEGNESVLDRAARRKLQRMRELQAHSESPAEHDMSSDSTGSQPASYAHERSVESGETIPAMPHSSSLEVSEHNNVPSLFEGALRQLAAAAEDEEDSHFETSSPQEERADDYVDSTETEVLTPQMAHEKDMADERESKSSSKKGKSKSVQSVSTAKKGHTAKSSGKKKK
jgi:hypothetical protein